MNIYCDYDSMLTDMSFIWLEWVNHTYGTKYKQKDVTSWEFYGDIGKDDSNDIKPYEWFDNGYPFALEKFSTRPLQGASEFFNELTDLYNTYILTATRHVEHQASKNDHINYYFNTSAVIHEAHKQRYAVCSTTGKANILIDDRLTNCLVFAAKGGHAILYNHNDEYEYNRMYRNMNGIHRATNYDEVLEIIKEIKNGKKE